MVGKLREESLKDYSDKIDDAKKTVVTLMQGQSTNLTDVLFETNLETVEQGIKNLNEYASKCWLVSSITLYSLIYDKEMYKQSGLDWVSYMHESRKRLGMESRDVSESLSSARYFIKYHKELLDAGWSPFGSARKLARAEYAEELSKNHAETIKHIVNDTSRDFKDWYSSFEQKNVIATQLVLEEQSKVKYDYTKGSYKVDGQQAVTLSDDLTPDTRKKLEGYLDKIFASLKKGYEPAIIPVKDNDEANDLIKLHDGMKK